MNQIEIELFTQSVNDTQCVSGTALPVIRVVPDWEDENFIVSSNLAGKLSETVLCNALPTVEWIEANLGCGAAFKRDSV